MDLYSARLLEGAFGRASNKRFYELDLGLWNSLSIMNSTSPWYYLKLGELAVTWSWKSSWIWIVSYVKDVHTIAVQNGGLNFSVGFTLDQFGYIDWRNRRVVDTFSLR